MLRVSAASAPTTHAPTHMRRSASDSDPTTSSSKSDSEYTTPKYKLAGQREMNATVHAAVCSRNRAAVILYTITMAIAAHTRETSTPATATLPVTADAARSRYEYAGRNAALCGSW